MLTHRERFFGAHEQIISLQHQLSLPTIEREDGAIERLEAASPEVEVFPKAPNEDVKRVVVLRIGDIITSGEPPRSLRTSVYHWLELQSGVLVPQAKKFQHVGQNPFACTKEQAEGLALGANEYTVGSILEGIEAALANFRHAPASYPKPRLVEQ
jgi:hypothetical protein